ncbi:MAG: DnaJ domain-containing protein [Deltaproteobacteria bacterium]|nr:DnaJ domain-containing protein [Deltaproteobacteria bacterium]
MADTAVTFQKFFAADDVAGNEDFAARLRDRAVVLRSPEGLETAVAWAELPDEARAFLTLLRLPRRFKDLEGTGLLPPPKAQGALRGLHSAELLDTLGPDKARALVPVEIRKALADQKGQQLVRKKLVANIYRPGVDEDPAAASTSSPAAEPAPPPPPPKPATAMDDPQFRDLKKEVDAAHGSLGKGNHFEVLGLQRTDGDDAVKKAYLGLVRKWHPDRLGGWTGPEVEEVRTRMAALFAAVGDAHRVLGDTKTRTAYLEDLKKREASGPAGDNRRAPVRAEEAKLYAQKGRFFLKQKDYAQAEGEMKRAVDCDPALAEYKVDWAWAMALNPTKPEKERRQKALEVFRELAKTTRYADAHYKLGLLFRVLGEGDKSEGCFRRCLELDSKHEEAAREVRLLEMRAEKARHSPPEPGPDDGKGVLGKLKKALGG